MSSLFFTSALAALPIIPHAEAFHLFIQLGFAQGLCDLLAIQPRPDTFCRASAMAKVIAAASATCFFKRGTSTLSKVSDMA